MGNLSSWSTSDVWGWYFNALGLQRSWWDSLVSGSMRPPRHPFWYVLCFSSRSFFFFHDYRTVVSQVDSCECAQEIRIMGCVTSRNPGKQAPFLQMAYNTPCATSRVSFFFHRYYHVAAQGQRLFSTPQNRSGVPKVFCTPNRKLDCNKFAVNCHCSNYYHVSDFDVYYKIVIFSHANISSRERFEEPNDEVHEKELSCSPSTEAEKIPFVPGISSVFRLCTDITPCPGVKMHRFSC